jgi:hypothetical protein
VKVHCNECIAIPTKDVQERVLQAEELVSVGSHDVSDVWIGLWRLVDYVIYNNEDDCG